MLAERTPTVQHPLRTGAGAGLDEAALLVARNGGAAVIRSRHRRRPDGRCTSCRPPTHWPCLHIAIAERAERLCDADTRR